MGNFIVNDLREQLADVIEVAIDNAHDMDVTHRDYANAAASAIIAALPSIMQPLIWEKVQKHYRSGDYTILNFGGSYLVDLNDLSIWHGRNVEGAKDAAQAHHVATIMRALGIEND